MTSNLEPIYPVMSMSNLTLRVTERMLRVTEEPEKTADFLITGQLMAILIHIRASPVKRNVRKDRRPAELGLKEVSGW